MVSSDALAMAALIRIDRQWTAPDSDGARPIRFCSRCGEPSNEPPKAQVNLIRDRVCGQCGMGLMLSCTRDALPGPAAVFMVFTYELVVSAVSEAAERVFGLEQELLGRHLNEVLTSPMGDVQLASQVARAGQRACEPVILPVRGLSPNADSAGTMAARISTCGPPRAALVTMEPSDFGHR
jgi:hypothetical protein